MPSPPFILFADHTGCRAVSEGGAETLAFGADVGPEAAAQGLLMNRPDAGPALVLIGEGEQVNVIAVRDGMPLAWALVPAADAEGVRLQCDVLSLDLGAAARAIACDVPAPLRAALNVAA